MSFGLGIWNGAGKTLLDTTSRITIVLGVANIPAAIASGTISHAKFANGTPWFAVTANGIVDLATVSPAVSVSGTTLSWSWGSVPPQDCLLIYGIY